MKKYQVLVWWETYLIHQKILKVKQTYQLLNILNYSVPDLLRVLRLEGSKPGYKSKPAANIFVPNLAN
jgi:hypothetical protein